MFLRLALFLLVFWAFYAVSDVVIQSQVSIDYLKGNVTFEQLYKVQSPDGIKNDDSGSYYGGSTPFDDSDTHSAPGRDYSLPEVVVNWAYDVLYSIDYKTVFLLTLSVAESGNKEIEYIPIQKQVLMYFGAVSLQLLQQGQPLFNQLDNACNEIIVFPLDHESTPPDVTATDSSSEVALSGAADSGKGHLFRRERERSDDEDDRDEEHSENHQGCTVCGKQVCNLCPCDQCVIGQLVNKTGDDGLALSQLISAVRSVLEEGEAAVQCGYENGVIECTAADSSMEAFYGASSDLCSSKRCQTKNPLVHDLSGVQQLLSENKIREARIRLVEILKMASHVQLLTIMHALKRLKIPLIDEKGNIYDQPTSRQVRRMIGREKERKKNVKAELRNVMEQIDKNNIDEAIKLLKVFIDCYDENDYRIVVSHLTKHGIPVIANSQFMLPSVGWSVKLVHEIMETDDKSLRHSSGFSSFEEIKKAVSTGDFVFAEGMLMSYLHNRPRDKYQDTARILKASKVPVIKSGRIVEGAEWNPRWVLEFLGETYDGPVLHDQPHEIKLAYDGGDLELFKTKLCRYLIERPKDSKDDVGRTAKILNRAAIPVYIADRLIENKRWSADDVRAALGGKKKQKFEVTPQMIKGAADDESARVLLRRFLVERPKDSACSKYLNQGGVPVFISPENTRWTTALVSEARRSITVEETTDMEQPFMCPRRVGEMLEEDSGLHKKGKGKKRKSSYRSSPDYEARPIRKQRKK